MGQISLSAAVMGDRFKKLVVMGLRSPKLAGAMEGDRQFSQA
jgi:hypothetical protein